MYKGKISSFGRHTTIYGNYEGEVPVQKAKQRNRISIPNEDFRNAITNIDVAKIDSKLEGSGEKTILKRVYETLFDNKKTSFNVNVDGLSFSNKDYCVTVN